MNASSFEIERLNGELLDSEWDKFELGRLCAELAEALSVLLELKDAQYMGDDTPETCPCPQCVAARKAEAILKKHNIL